MSYKIYLLNTSEFIIFEKFIFIDFSNNKNYKIFHLGSCLIVINMDNPFRDNHR